MKGLGKKLLAQSVAFGNVSITLYRTNICSLKNNSGTCNRGITLYQGNDSERKNKAYQQSPFQGVL